MDDVAIDEQAVWLIRSMARRLTQPRAGECLVCYVARMLDEFGCDTTLRFARQLSRSGGSAGDQAGAALG